MIQLSIMFRKLPHPNIRAIFLHIPKTAGTTIHRIIERQYPAKHIYSTFAAPFHTEKPIAALKKLPDSERAIIYMLRGHMAFGLHEWLPGRSTYFTFLREPVARVVSHYRFIANQPAHYLHDFVITNNLDLENFLKSRSFFMTNNAHTRVISGVWDKVAYGACTQTHLEQAKENLRTHFSVVGLTERFDETLMLLKRSLGWRMVYYTKHNVSLKRREHESLSPTTRDIIQQDNALDIELYAYAKELFEAHLQTQDPSFHVELAQFRARNRLVSPLLSHYWKARRYSVRSWIKQRFNQTGALWKSNR